MEVAAAAAQLCELRPAAIVTAQVADLTEMEDQRRFGVLVRSASGAGFHVLCLGGRGQDGDQIWPQRFLAVLGRRAGEAALRAWAVQSRQVYGQEVVIFKSARCTQLLFESGRTEIWPGFSLDLVTKAYERSRGRGTLTLDRALVLSPAAFGFASIIGRWPSCGA